jgi:Tol biopolymer transport system component
VVVTEAPLTDGSDYGEYPTFLDASTVLYAAGRSLKVVSIEPGGSPAVLASTAPLVPSRPTVGPGGTIAFTGTIPGIEGQIYTLSPWTGTITPLTSPARGDTNGLEPAFSPDGSKIVFVSHRTGTAQIYQMASDGQGPRTNLSRSTTPDTMPAWAR